MKIIIFGAGQSGRMIKKLLHGSCELVAYADNNYMNLPNLLDNIPVISPKEISDIMPDKVIVSVINKEASEEICRELVNEGISKSNVLNINDLRELFDVRLSQLRLLAKEVNERNVEGSIAELGVYKGYIAKELNLLFKDRKLYLFDTFEGFDNKDTEFEKTMNNSNSIGLNFSDTSIQQVKSILPYPKQAIFCKGYFPDTAENIDDKFALVSLDPDLYLPTLNGLKYFYPKLSKGGYILIHDYNSIQFPNVKKAVDDFAKEEDIMIVPLCDIHGSAVIPAANSR